MTTAHTTAGTHNRAETFTERPAACFGIAGRGSTNLLTGRYHTKVTRFDMLGALTRPVLALVEIIADADLA
jgi:thiamine pyrophosphate-dependent acetolactate synthase large subunit-like protein